MRSEVEERLACVRLGQTCTDWTLYGGMKSPRIPLNNNSHHYILSDMSAIAFREHRTCHDSPVHSMDSSFELQAISTTTDPIPVMLVHSLCAVGTSSSANTRLIDTLIFPSSVIPNNSFRFGSNDP